MIGRSNGISIYTEIKRKRKILSPNVFVLIALNSNMTYERTQSETFACSVGVVNKCRSVGVVDKCRSMFKITPMSITFEST